jgi:hypothetical protein
MSSRLSLFLVADRTAVQPFPTQDVLRIQQNPNYEHLTVLATWQDAASKEHVDCLYKYGVVLRRGEESSPCIQTTKLQLPFPFFSLSSFNFLVSLRLSLLNQ